MEEATKKGGSERDGGDFELTGSDFSLEECPS
jgi:hypothetical protein